MACCLADLGMIPLCQSFIEKTKLDQGEMFYPLRANVCMHCYYVGLPVYVSPHEIFSEYAYISSVSSSWIEYVRSSVESLVAEFRLSPASQVIEMGSNDGYLLQFFVEKGIPALGVEPAENVARVANARGIPTLAAFFNRQTAEELRKQGKCADLLLSYNCLDHVPDLNDMVAGMKLLLNPWGVIQVEIPYLDSLVASNQFDTIYHDRFSYLSFLAAEHLFDRNGLRIFDVAWIPTHGGSLRLRACHVDNPARPVLPSVATLRADETDRGMKTPGYYSRFMEQVTATKRNLLEFLIRQKRDGRSIVGYGAPAKGNVLLNYCGIGSDFIDYLVDRNPYKRGKFAPGTRLPVLDVEEVRRTRPDFLLILPWNIKDEIISQMSDIRDWGGRFLVPIPAVDVF
jgi:SAM-dependent methyltransferase